MKVLLFNPPTADGRRFIREGRCTQEEGAWGTLWPPISLATAAAVVEKHGHQVHLRDFPAVGDGLADLDDAVRTFQPDLAVWSSATPSIDSDLSLAARLKAIRPTLVTGTFSTHAATLAEECFQKFPKLDLVLRGEPELTIGELADALEKNTPLSAINGLIIHRPDGSVERTPERELPKNLDDIPDPAWNLLDLNAYRLPLKGRKFLMLVPTRGCPYACSFCTTHSYYGKNLRRRSPARVIAELRRNVETFGVHDFLFWSDTFTLDKAYVKELCDAILASGLNIAWASNSRVDTVERETFVAMKQAGCWMVSFGIESGSQEVLNKLHKGADVSEAKQAVGWAKDAGLQTTGHFVLGLPGDTEQSIRETILFSKNLGLDFAQYYCAVPFPGSSLFVEARQKGWLPETPWESFRQDKAILQLPGLPAERVQALRDEASIQFYASPLQWLSKFSMLRPAALPDLLRRLMKFLKWRHAA